MIELYKFGPAFGLRETGPFALKTIAYMRLAGIPFTEHIEVDPRKACLLYTSPSPRDATLSRMPSSA